MKEQSVVFCILNIEFYSTYLEKGVFFFFLVSGGAWTNITVHYHLSPLNAIGWLYFEVFIIVLQLIESRVSTFQSALQLSSCIDFLYAGVCFFLVYSAVSGNRQVIITNVIYSLSLQQVVDDALEEDETVTPVIYEDNDESEEESEDAMETDQDSKEEEAFEGLSDIEGSDGMSE